MPDPERLLITQRLRLEPLLVAHAKPLFEFLRDERQYRYYANEAPSSIDELKARFAALETRLSPDTSERWFNWVVRMSDGTIVGRVQATVRSDYTLIGYDIFVPFWRKGYGKEACGAMLDFLEREHGITKFRAIVDAENLASIKLLERLGFQRVWTGPSDDMPGRIDHRFELDVKGPKN